MNILIALIVIACFVVIISYIINKINHMRYIKATRNIAFQSYVKGIETKDTSLMYRAMDTMCTTCPCRIELCKINRMCPNCDCEYGFKEDLERMYGEIITPWNLKRN